MVQPKSLCCLLQELHLHWEAPQTQQGPRFDIIPVGEAFCLPNIDTYCDTTPFISPCKSSHHFLGSFPEYQCSMRSPTWWYFLQHPSLFDGRGGGNFMDPFMFCIHLCIHISLLCADWPFIVPEESGTIDSAKHMTKVLVYQRTDNNNDTQLTIW